MVELAAAQAAEDCVGAAGAEASFSGVMPALLITVTRFCNMLLLDGAAAAGAAVPSVKLVCTGFESGAAVEPEAAADV